MDAADQVAIDNVMIDLDGTPNKGRLGAISIFFTPRLPAVWT